MRHLIAFGRAAAAWALVTVAACSHPAAPSPPGPPPPGAPAIQCPSDVRVEVADSPSAAVNYPAPQVSGGSAPVSVACTIASGTVIDSGTRDITCTATDAASMTSQCVFHVSVSVIPRLKGTKIVAFGDSITAGEISPAVQSTTHYFDPSNSYPTVLQDLLRSRYKAQEVVVINEGIGGEKVLQAGPSGTTGEGRIEKLAVQHRPDVLIVLEGVNGLGTLEEADLISEGLRRGVRRAVRQGVPLVLVSTILPGVTTRPGSKAANPDAVLALNDGIRGWAGAERAVLVDSYAAFAPMKELLIGADGLHPNLDGYKQLAQIFFEALQANFEAPPPAAATAAAGRRSVLSGQR